MELVGAADTLRAEIGSPRAPAQAEALTVMLEPAREALADDADAAIERGRILSGDDAASLAESVCTPD